jgi:hypothetical protein
MRDPAPRHSGAEFFFRGIRGLLKQPSAGGEHNDEKKEHHGVFAAKQTRAGNQKHEQEHHFISAGLTWRASYAKSIHEKTPLQEYRFRFWPLVQRHQPRPVNL